MSEQTTTPLQAWLNEWQTLTGEAGRIAVRLQQLSALPPSPLDAEDARRLLAWRESAAGLDGPGDVERTRAAVEQLGGPFNSLLWQAKSTAGAMLGASERVFAAGGAGVVSGKDLAQEQWFFFPYGHRFLIGVHVEKLPPDHVLRTLTLDESERLNGTAAVLGEATVRSGDFGRVIAPRAWYPLHEVPRWGRVAEQERRREEAESEHVAQVLLARQRADQEFADRQDPKKRLERLEKEFSEINKREDQPCPS
jgi:hypothetical protein